MLDNYPFQGVLEVFFVRGHPNFQTYPCILGPKVLDFKGIFGAIMRKGICYDFRRRVGAKHALAQRMLWTSLFLTEASYHSNWMSSTRLGRHEEPFLERKAATGISQERVLLE